jgi:ankyrin repeat protein
MPEGQRQDHAREQTIEAPEPGAPRSMPTRLLRAIDTKSEKAALAEISELSIQERDAKGRGPLHYAAMRGSLPVLQALISAGAVDSLDSDGRSALLMSCDLPSAESCQALLSSGSDPANVDKLNWTPMSVAIDSNSLECVAALARMGEKVLERRDRNGFTPARFAIECRKIDCLRILLDAGAKPDSFDDEAIELIDAAANSDWPEGVRALAKAGANPRTLFGGPIMEAAAREGRVELLAAMIDAVASTKGEPIDHQFLLEIAEESRAEGRLSDAQIVALRVALAAARRTWLSKQPLLRKLMERLNPSAPFKVPGAR